MMSTLPQVLLEQRELFSMLANKIRNVHIFRDALELVSPFEKIDPVVLIVYVEAIRRLNKAGFRIRLYKGEKKELRS